MQRALIYVVFLLACGDDGSSSTAGSGGTSGAGGGGGAVEYSCRQSCETNAECAGFPLSGCAGEINCSGWPSSQWRPEVTAAYQGCEAGCPTDPQACVNAAFAAAGAARAVDTQYDTACEAKDLECGLANDACDRERLFTESTVMQALACLDLPCAMVSSCLEPLLE